MNYQIGPWTFYSNESILKQSDTQRVLDPLLVKLLTYFIENPNIIISRVDLAKNVWMAEIVDDNTINRVVSELRKCLSHPNLPNTIIKTHHRRGYSLQIKPVSLEKEQIDISDSCQNELTSNKSRLILLTLLFVVPCVFIYLYAVVNDDIKKGKLFTQEEVQKNENRTKFQQKIITWKVGLEALPLLSFDKAYLAFSHLKKEKNGYQLFIRRLHDGKEINLTYPNHNLSGLAWQNKAHTIIAMATNLKLQSCYIVAAKIKSLDLSPDFKVLRECNYRTDGYVQLDKASTTLYFTSSDNKLASLELKKLNLSSGKESTLIDAKVSQLNPASPKLSPDERYLAFVNFDPNALATVYLYDLKNNEIKKLYSANRAKHSYALDWKDKNTLYFVDYNTVFKIDITTKKVSDGIQLPLFEEPYYLAMSSENGFYYSSRKSNKYSLVHSSIEGNIDEALPLFNSEADTFNAVYDEQSQVYYFISYRSGENQIWQGDQAMINQLSNFTQPKNKSNNNISHLKISPDSKNLLFLLNGDLAIFNISKKTYKLLDDLSDFKVSDFSWNSSQSSFVFLSKKYPNRIYSYDLISRQVSLEVEKKTHSLFSDDSFRPWAYVEDGLLNITTGTVYKLPDNISLTKYLKFEVIKNKVFATDRIFSIYHFELKDSNAKAIHLPFKLYDFEVTSEGQIIITKRSPKNTQIKHINW